MARTLAQVQTTLTALYATYDALAAKVANSLSASDRDIAYRDMKAVRMEIEAMERLEAEMTTAATVETAPQAGVSFARFQDPRSGY